MYIHNLDKNKRYIFQIGFNKCGTRSLTRFFKRNGIPSIHWDRKRLAKNIIKNIRNSLPPLLGFSNHIAFADMESLTNDEHIEIYKKFETLYEYYPKSYFILNTRNVFDWIRSREAHGQYLKRYAKVHNLHDYNQVIYHWHEDWYEHHCNVLKFFRNKKTLLIYDIDRHNGKILQNFLKNSFNITNPEILHIGKTVSARNQ